MAIIEGSPEEALTAAQEIVKRHVSEAVCELQRYKTQIGCGVLDERGNLHEMHVALRGLTEFHVESEARALASRSEPRTALRRQW